MSTYVASITTYSTGKDTMLLVLLLMATRTMGSRLLSNLLGVQTPGRHVSTQRATNVVDSYLRACGIESRIG